jgi:short-subunit dehydrogenase
MNSQAKPVAVITGASSGLGLDFAREAAADGYDLVLIARSTAPMESLASELQARYETQTHVIGMDLAVPGAGANAADAIAKLGVTVDVLINNAGFGFNGSFADSDPHETSRMTQLNIVTLTDLTRALLPAMLARKSGRVMLLASTAAFQPGPMMAVYCATKAYVLSFGEALAYELRGTGVSVTTVCPGATETNFQKAASIDANSTLMKSPMMSSATVAKDGYWAMKRGRRVIVTGIPNLIGAVMGRILPRDVVLPIAAKLLAK